jgi:hypothetical protein
MPIVQIMTTIMLWNVQIQIMYHHIVACEEVVAHLIKSTPNLKGKKARQDKF